jgi:hypothetical protein
LRDDHVADQLDVAAYQRESDQEPADVIDDCKAGNALTG